MRKNIRRKNLSFRPAGEDPLHDKAVCFLDQIGRGQSDFVASAVVYYAMMLSEGKIDKDHAKQLNTHRIRAKIIAAPSLATSNIYPVIDNEGKETSSIKDQSKIPVAQTEEREQINGGESIDARPPNDPVNTIVSQEGVSGPLPDDMVKSLLGGFRIR